MCDLELDVDTDYFFRISSHNVHLVNELLRIFVPNKILQTEDLITDRLLVFLILLLVLVGLEDLLLYKGVFLKLLIRFLPLVPVPLFYSLDLF